MFLLAYTLLHVAISLVAIAAGVVVLFGFLSGRRFDRTTPVFLWTTIATSVTGYGFPFVQVLPSHIVGAISLVVLAGVLAARTRWGLGARWRAASAGGSVLALYLNVFVLIVQLFLKVPALTALAPTQTEPAFVGAQVLTLVVFTGLGIVAAKRVAHEPVMEFVEADL